MNLTLNSTTFADVEIQSVTVQPVAGAFEIVFSLFISIHARQNRDYRASIFGARISMKVGSSAPHAIGFARAERTLYIESGDNNDRTASALILLVQPGQLRAIEDFRGNGDLEFELLVKGTGNDGHGQQAIEETWRIAVPRSDWLKRLRDANARNVLLLEVPMPLARRSKPWAEIEKHLSSAEKHYRNGDYHECVASCRTVIQELGHHKYRKTEWSAPLLDRLASGRKEMTKVEREAALWGAVRHYTNQAHHGDSEGGETMYSRAEAQMILTLAASFVAHAHTG